MSRREWDRPAEGGVSMFGVSQLFSQNSRTRKRTERSHQTACDLHAFDVGSDMLTRRVSEKSPPLVTAHHIYTVGGAAGGGGVRKRSRSLVRERTCWPCSRCV